MTDFQPMRRATAAEAKAMRAQLVSWRAPANLRLELRAMEKPHGFYAASQGAMQFWREAWCACAFAEEVGADAVRLHENDPPDFVLRLGNRSVDCELAEVRAPSARTGYEFDEAARRHNNGEQQPWDAVDPEMHLQWLGERIEAVIARKAGMSYGEDVVLAIYAHAWILDSRREQAKLVCADAVAPFANRFAAVWVMVSGSLLRFGRDVG